MTWLLALWRSSIGKKFLMAATGVVLFGFVIGHLLGNLQIFAGDGGKALNDYAHMLKSKPPLLWGARVFLLGALFVHIAAAITLTRRNRLARPVAYGMKRHRAASIYARTMMISGPVIAAFVIWHLLHLTTGHLHPDQLRDKSFQPAEVYHNVIALFSVAPVAIGYVIANILLGFHLFHGGWSMFQSIGVNHPRWTPIIKLGMGALALCIALGNVLIPLVILFGYGRGTA